MRIMVTGPGSLGILSILLILSKNPHVVSYFNNRRLRNPLNPDQRAGKVAL